MNVEPGIYRPEFPMDGNFTMVPNALIRDDELPGNAKLLLIYLLSHKVGYHILDSQMIRESGLGREALRTARKKLEQFGFINLERVRNADHSLGAYRYEIKDARGWFSSDGFPSVGYPSVGQPTVGNPPDNIKLIPKKTTSKKTKVDNTSDFDFNEFWSIYPRQQARGKAKEAFIKATKDFGLEPVMDGVRRYAADPNLPDPQFVPLPATWLNQERWADGPLPLNRKLTNSERNIQNFRAKLALLENEPMKEVESGQVTSRGVADFGISLRSADNI
jgi:hypothetical protein